MTQSIIFVDIDGVLLPGKMHLFHQNQKIKSGKLNDAEPMFDQFAVRCFNLWAKYGDAKVVFSTNWAVNLNDPKLQLPKIMADNGLELNYHREILTPKKFSSERGSEIWWWVMDNMEDGDKFIAVDDDQSCRYLEDYMRPRESDKKYPNGVVKPQVHGKWINVDFVDGMSIENFTDGCDVLGINMDDINEGEFGITPLTEEEREERKEDLDLLIRCMV